MRAALLGMVMIGGLLLAAGAGAAERVALVIGNGAYPKGDGLFTPLANPRNDAADVAKALAGYGFEVLPVVKDGDQQAMDAAVERFAQALSPGGVGLFYYSGHGVQVDGENYLIPVGRSLRDAADVKYRALKASRVLEKMALAGARVNVMILDACREPLPAARTKGFQNKGFTSMSVRGAIIGYATRPGAFALGDSTRRNSVYTEKLLQALGEASRRPIEMVFKRAASLVDEATGNHQTPWYENGLIGGDFCFDGCGRVQLAQAGPVQVPAAPPRDTLGDGTPGPEMVPVPGGCFWMGSPEDEAGRGDDEHRHRVCVEDFQLGRREVTVGEFRRFVTATGYRTDAERNAGGEKGCWALDLDDAKKSWQWRDWASWRKPNKHQAQQDTHPVACVSWNDALAYAAWLSRETGHRYRLPTEAEWEYAARAGTTTARFWGDDPEGACAYANVADTTEQDGHSWAEPRYECADGYYFAAPVGTFRANPWGLQDMLGNVWEWTCSLYQAPYDGAAEKACAGDSEAGRRVFRGGSWYGRPRWVRSALRGYWAPADRYGGLGFRLARIN